MPNAATAARSASSCTTVGSDASSPQATANSGKSLTISSRSRSSTAREPSGDRRTGLAPSHDGPARRDRGRFRLPPAELRGLLGTRSIEIDMSLTALGRGIGDVLRDDAARAVLAVPAVDDVEVYLVCALDDPPDVRGGAPGARLGSCRAQRAIGGSAILRSMAQCRSSPARRCRRPRCHAGFDARR